MFRGQLQLCIATIRKQETTRNNYKNQQEQQNSLSHVGEVVNPKDSALSPAVQMATLNAR